MKKLGWVMVSALVVIACSTGADMMSEMMDSGVPDANAQGGSWSSFDVECDNSQARIDNPNITDYWAEFPISEPSQTEITVCRATTGWVGLATCSRRKTTWVRGTNTGVEYCGAVQRNDSGDVLIDSRTDVISITVHDPT